MTAAAKRHLKILKRRRDYLNEVISSQQDVSWDHSERDALTWALRYLEQKEEVAMRRHLFSSTVNIYTDDEEGDDPLDNLERDWEATMEFLNHRLSTGGYLKTYTVEEQEV